MKNLSRIGTLALSLLLVLTLLFAVTACGQEKQIEETPDNQTLDLSSDSLPEASESNSEGATDAPSADAPSASTPSASTPSEAPTDAPSEVPSDAPSADAPSEAPSESASTPSASAPSEAPTEKSSASTPSASAPSEAPTERMTTEASYADTDFASTVTLEVPLAPLKQGVLYDTYEGAVEIGDAVSLYDICPTVDKTRVYALVSDTAKLSQEAAAALSALCEAAYRESGMRVHLRTAAHMEESAVGYGDYRSLKSVKIGYYDESTAVYHAFDEEKTRPLADFIRANAYRFGFIDLSTKNDAGHFRYVGLPHAAVMTDEGIATLADYHAFLDSRDRYLHVSLNGVNYYVRSYAVSGETAAVKVPAAHQNACTLSASGYGSTVVTVTLYASGKAHPLPYVADMNANRKDKVICLDAGHGAHDPGAVWPQTTNPTYLEKEYNLAVAKEAKAYLEAMGYTVIMTRNDDTFVSLDNRVAFAKQYGADLFISFHCNSTATPDSPTAVGPQVYFNQSESTQFYNWTIARAFRNAINTATASYIAQGEAKPVDEDDLRSGGDLRVLRDYDLPSVLLEMGFITNEGDRALFEDSAWRETMGYAVAMAVESLFASDHLGLQ